MVRHHFFELREGFVSHSCPQRESPLPTPKLHSSPQVVLGYTRHTVSGRTAGANVTLEHDMQHARHLLVVSEMSST